jgi:NADH-quinone oxidoreductase subunit C
MKSFEEILPIIQAACSAGEAVTDDSLTPKGVKLHSGDLRNVCRELYQDPSVFFDMLSCITAVDNGPAIGTIDIIYNLYSIPFNHHVALKISVTRDHAEVDSVQDIWKTANWHEREAWDMFGVTFTGHPDLRRILLPADWEGHPLRKDYKQQEYYRGIKVEY